MAVTKPPIAQKPVSTSNYSVGRGGKAIRKITFHHIVGSLDSAYNSFSNPTRGASSHYGVGDGRIWQFVDLGHTAWANGNFTSNQESITIEHEGDWRNGFRSQGVIDTSAKLVAWLRTQYPGITFNRHREVSLTGTVCPADLPVEEIWNKATELMNVPAPAETPTTPVNLQPIDITNRRIVLNKDASLWDLSFRTWAEAKPVKSYLKGTEIEISATVKHQLGGLYYMTEYSFSKGIMNGFNSADCSEVIVVPPVVIPPVEPPVIPPVVVPPVEPEYPNWFIQFWLKLIEAIKGIITRK